VNNIGGVLHAKGDIEGALRCGHEAFSILIRMLGPRALETIQSARNLRAVDVDPIGLAREVAGEEAAGELARALDG